MLNLKNRRRVYAPTDETVVTKQSAKDECDIYKILKQYQRTGILTHTMPNQPTYAHLPDATDYHEALNKVIEAEAAFGTLPAAMRDEYGNDPHAFLAALHDPAQRDKLVSLGVIAAPAVPAAPDLSDPAA